jgi:predicted Rossmann fold flavoprotein
MPCRPGFNPFLRSCPEGKIGIMPVMKKDVAVIGAGAAGLFCAVECGKRGRSVVLLEHTEAVGNKIRISGGGACNFTNRFMDETHFVSSNPHFARSALSRFTPQDMIALLERHKIRIVERKWGQLFTRDGAERIVTMLRDECARANVAIQLDCRIEAVSKSESFEIATSQGRFESASLVIATGGLAMPKIGATPLGYRIARQFGLKVIEPRPALVPLLWREGDLANFKDLSGLAFDTIVKCGPHHYRENILFTHRGLSGPAVLQVSSHWKEGQAISIDLFPERDIFQELTARRTDRTELSTFLSSFLPKRFVKKWCELYSPSKPLNRTTEKELRAVAERLHDWPVTPKKKDGYAAAEVTGGGVDTDGISSKTMGSVKNPGLFFAGEVLDVTGELGGYNLQWAWSSGWAAGQFA